LIPAVLRHWNQTILDEDETLVSFAFALRKQATSGSGTAPGIISRPFVVKGNASRSGTKAKGR
jgi:histone deacetylase complex subunit SAP30